MASWSVSFTHGRESLREAAEPLGLWPACAPDARGDRGPLLRRPLPDPTDARVHSLTATVAGGLIRGLTVFDEPPEWLPGGGA